MEKLKNNNSWIIGMVVLFLGINSYLIFQDNYYFMALPIALIVAYIGIFHTHTTFLVVAFFAPLSINLEEFTDGRIGLFLPTEPLLFGLLLLAVFKQIKNPYLPKYFWRHPITLSMGFYLTWLLISAITSTHPIVSFKFLLMKSWFIVPIFMLGFTIFSKRTNIKKLLWCYSIAMSIVIVYTLIHHSMYGFGEREGHWVMSPFFKDHTGYGAAIALSLFFIIGLLFSKKHSFENKTILIVLLLITCLGLYFSSTRGAWLSVAFALGVWGLIRFKIKFKYLMTLAAVIGIVVAASWTEIQHELERVDHEHTSESMEGRIQSMANTTTDASNLERLNRWTAALNMFQEKPIFGFGPGTYAFEYAPYQNPERLTIISTNFGDGGNAHSEYLGPLSETGALGLVSVLLFVGFLFYKGINLLIQIKYKKPNDKEIYILLLCLILATSTYFFHGILNNYLDQDKAAVPIYSIAVIIIAQEYQLFISKKEENLKSIN